MLSSFRKASKSWLAKGLMLTLAGAFGLWGINDIFRGGSSDTSVASVGDHKIAAADYDRELKAELRRESQNLHTDLTMEQARSLGLTQGVLERMISRQALDDEAAKLGLTASNETVAKEIRGQKQFQGENGAFDHQLLDEALQQNNLSEAMFEDGYRLDIARAQLMDSAVDWLEVPAGMTGVLFDYLNQTRVAEYLVLTPDMAGAMPQPTDAELDAFHKTNAARYSTPEYRELDFVEIGPEQFSDSIKVTDADIKKEYDEHKDDFIKAEQRDIEQINFPSKEAALAAQQKIAAGTDFLAVAQGMGLKESDVKLGSFAKSGLDATRANAAFAVAEGSVTPAIQGPFGWVIIKVTKVTPGVNKTFDELKDTLRQQVTKDRALSQSIDAANKFEDARGGGATLDDAANKVGLTAIHVAAVDDKGMAPNGSKANVPAPAVFLRQAFAAQPGDEGDIFQSDEQHSYAIKVVSVTPPALKPLDQVRDQVVKDWTESKRATLLADRVKTLAAQAQNDGNLAGIAKTLGHEPLVSQPLKRDTTSDVFSRALLAELFNTPPGKVVAGQLGKGAGFVIARATKVQNPDPAMAAGDFEDNRRQLSQQVANDLVKSMSASARATEGATINQDSLNRFFGGASNE